MTGYFGVGIWHTKTAVNVGTLLRSAHAFGANFVFTVGRRYSQQSSDVSSAWRHIPLYHYESISQLKRHLPHGCSLVGVELDDRATPLSQFIHPEREVLLLGAEDHGLTPEAKAACHHLVQIEGTSFCLNVATAGTIVMYDRVTKRR